MSDASADILSLVREVSDACTLLTDSTQADRVAAESLLVDRVVTLLRTLGFGVYQSRLDQGRARGQEPSFRIETSVDYAVRDVWRAAGVARSRARKQQSVLCTPEPMEEDPMGVLIDLLDLEIPRSDLRGIVDVLSFEQNARALTASELRSSKGPDLA